MAVLKRRMEDRLRKLRYLNGDRDPGLQSGFAGAQPAVTSAVSMKAGARLICVKAA
jgi:hypothetical protein